MISIRRHGTLGRPLWALIGTVLAVAVAGPGVALAASAGKQPPGKARGAQQMQPPINAQTDPAAAATAVQAAGSVSNISWQTNTAPGGCAGGVPAPTAPVQPAPCVPASNNTAHYAVTDGWGTPSVFGDVLYNCGQIAPAESDAGKSDTRQQSWSLSEKVSLKITAGLPNIVSVSDEVSAFSKQSNTFAATVTVTSGVEVDPGWKGWTTVQYQTLTVPGTAYVTDPLRNTLTPVQDLDLTFPGYAPAGASETSLTTHAVKMTPTEIQTICDTSPVNTAARHHTVFGSGLTVTKPGSWALGVCGPTGPCRARTVTGGLPPSRIRRATARLTRAGQIYGRGSYADGHTQVHVSRALPPGPYQLKLTEPSQRVGNVQHKNVTTLPVTVSAQTGA